MASNGERHFYCTARFRKAVRKAKHPQVAKQCATVQELLAIYPTHGVPHDRHSKVRKMRVAVPKIGVGKRGGYRAIYRAVKDEENESEWHVVFLDLYFKADVDDLSDKRYGELVEEAESALSNTYSDGWETLSAPPIPE